MRILLAVGLLATILVCLVEAAKKGSQPKDSQKITSINCDNSKSKTFVNSTCSLKAFKRGVTYLTAETYLNRRIQSNNVHVSLYFYKSRNISHQYISKMATIYYQKVMNSYKQVHKVSYDDFCKALGEKSLASYLVSSYLDKIAPGQFHACPHYPGKYGIFNQTLNDSWSVPLPGGEYKITFKIWDDIDANMYQLVLHFEIKSNAM